MPELRHPRFVFLLLLLAGPNVCCKLLIKFLLLSFCNGRVEKAEKKEGKQAARRVKVEVVLPLLMLLCFLGKLSSVINNKWNTERERKKGNKEREEEERCRE